jgi:decaprenylphospho-beta-D-ribofuranose 2-oxidase
MQAAELTAPAPARPQERELTGWGRTAPSRARVHVPAGTEQAIAAAEHELGRGSRGLIARGAGRSYGDAAQSGGGAVLDMTACSRVLQVDARKREVRVQAGATLAAVMARLAPHGLTLPVLPGTRHVTVAGAIASDVHGKGHERDGAFARHVRSIALWTPAEGVVEVSPQQRPELFGATLGGMGLTGIVLEATLAAEPAFAAVAADNDRTGSLEHTLAVAGDSARHRYSVAWVDMLARGSAFGRAVVSRADPLPASIAAIDSLPRALTAGARVEVPPRWPGWPLRPELVRAFNAARWRAAPRTQRGHEEAVTSFFFPLDVVDSWSRLYGSTGLIQYQLVLPLCREPELMRCFELLRRGEAPVYLAVLKRFGAASGGPLSFPIEGWTLAVDVPAATVRRGGVLDRLDDVVAEAGGRVYLSKDSRMRPVHVATMYPRLAEFRECCAGVDPEGALSSDLSRRLALREEL